MTSGLDTSLSSLVKANNFTPVLAASLQVLLSDVCKNFSFQLRSLYILLIA
ncbi:hypothetical protein [Nostoc sp.]|uniref:hypothetical protein n=1 Tax=Nostoc sp. TaxID=1180 RepID=UPI002FF73A5F